MEAIHELFNKVTAISDADWRSFACGLQFKKYATNSFLLKRGQVSDSIAFVAEGLFRMYAPAENREVNYNFFAEGQFAVDYESYLKGEASAFSIQALEDCEVYWFTKAHLLEQYARSHEWERFGRLVSERIFLKGRDRLKEMLFMSAEERYVRFTEQYVGLYERLPLYHIASYLGIDASSLSRIRKSMAQK